MIELGLALGLCFAVAAIARADEQSPGIWWFVTFGFCLLSLHFLPWPIMRLLPAGLAGLVAMFVWKLLR